MRMKYKFCLSLAMVWQLLAVGIAHAASNVLPYRPFPATWQAKLDEFTAKGDVPGAVVIVKSPVWGVRVGTSGVANLATGAKPSPTTAFRVGSVTKSFTAQTVLQLEQQGKIRLTDPILKHLGSSTVVSAIPNIAKVTIGDCLQMKTGIRNYLLNPTIVNNQFLSPLRHYTPEQLLAVLAPDAAPKIDPAFVPEDSVPNPYSVTDDPKNQTNSVQTLYRIWPGFFTNRADPTYWLPAWDYSNANYTLLGMLIEKVTGLTLGEAIRTMICDKAGLTDTFLPNDSTVPANMMRGYTKFNAAEDKQIYNDWHDMTDIDPSYAGAAGAIISTPWDLLRFLETMFKTEVFLNAATKEKWLTFVSADSRWFGNDYGMGGLIQAHRTYGDARGHGGFLYGYLTLTYYFHDSDTSFVLAINTTDHHQEVPIMDAIMPLVKSPAMAPQPANNATMTLPANANQVHLSWQAGRIYGDSYNVYWGSDAASVDTAIPTSRAGVNMVTTTNLTVAIGGQKAGTTNYWRVDTVAGTNTVTGSLWSFKIADSSAPQTLTITLSWQGIPGLSLQKKAALDSQLWQDIPDTDGKSSASFPATRAQEFFRLNRR